MSRDNHVDVVNTPPHGSTAEVKTRAGVLSVTLSRSLNVCMRVCPTFSDNLTFLLSSGAFQSISSAAILKRGPYFPNRFATYNLLPTFSVIAKLSPRFPISFVRTKIVGIVFTKLTSAEKKERCLLT